MGWRKGDDPPSNPSGTPVITGTRVHVAIVVGSLAGEMTMEEVMEAYELTQDQVRDALAYACSTRYGGDANGAIGFFGMG